MRQGFTKELAKKLKPGMKIRRINKDYISVVSDVVINIKKGEVYTVRYIRNDGHIYLMECNLRDFGFAYYNFAPATIVLPVKVITNIPKRR